MTNLNQNIESLKEQLKQLQQSIHQVIAEIDKAPDRSMIPEGTELLSVAQVALLLGWSECMVRQRDKLGLLPKPIRIGGTIQWRRKELLAWIDAGCPPRKKWEQLKQRKAG